MKPEWDAGTAGASARREHERRKAKRERRVRERHPRLGGFLLAVREAPADERAWARGAEGEERLAESFAKRLHEDVVVLHDRRIPRSRANIDHLVIAPSGVWVVDAKRYRGKIGVSKPLFGAATLRIAGRDRTKLVDGVERQVALVADAVAGLGSEVPVRGALCFIDADLPILGTLSVRDVPLLHPRALCKRLNAAGALGRDELSALASGLALRFPPAARTPA